MKTQYDKVANMSQEHEGMTGLFVKTLEVYHNSELIATLEELEESFSVKLAHPIMSGEDFVLIGDAVDYANRNLTKKVDV